MTSTARHDTSTIVSLFVIKSNGTGDLIAKDS